ncbi:MAG TPA: TAT-variant-translocated molybdopterin oxidoreductase, partial [Anaeromyxobacteraceae bacterium]|nr:TAT-variant-translocated molybdopterin oxidoreductase [Anaeromyxobacteraceae bacterium]
MSSRNGGAPGGSPEHKALPIYGQSGMGGPPAADGRRLWRSLADLSAPRSPSPEFAQGADEPPKGLSRRSFLQILGASAALASQSACRPSRQRIIPYVQPPEKALAPGTPLHYATALSLGGYATGVLVTVHDGRPTKVEGNPDHPASLGGAGNFELATLLDLYDPRRAKGFRKGQSPLAYRSVLRELSALAASHQGNEGAGLRFLTPGTASPLFKDLQRRILMRFPAARFYAYESLSDDAVREGGRLAFGRVLLPRHRLGAARVILALDSDFLAIGPESLRLAREFAEHREGGPDLSRLYVAEAQFSVTGACADHRFRMKPSEVLLFGWAVAARLASKPGLSDLAALGPAPALPEGRVREAAAVADDLARARGRSLVMAGPGQPPAVHALVHALNAALGNSGRTVEYAAPAFEGATGPSALRELAGELEAGKVDTLVVTASNPVYCAPATIDLGTLLGRARNSIYLGYRDDETAVRSSWGLAASHPFEAWGDSGAYDGTISIVQPLIQPLFESLSEVELIAAFIDLAEQGGHRILEEYWRRRAPGFDFERRWEGWLGRGLVPATAIGAERATPRFDRIAQEVGRSSASSTPLEANFVPDYKMYDGRVGENAWLQELPHPITRMTWDNAAYLSAATAGRLGISEGARVELRVGGRKLAAA